MNTGMQIFLQVLLSIILNIYLEVGLLDHMIVLFLIFWGIAILFSTAAARIYIPTNSAQGFQFPRIFTSTRYFPFLPSVVSILLGVKRYFIVVWICISLTISDAEHLFIHSVAICMSSLKQCLFSPLFILESGGLVFIVQLQEFFICSGY